jgi:Uma2 family endonuclease
MSRTITETPRPIDPRSFLSHPDALYEIVDGQVVELPEMGVFAAFVSRHLYNSLWNYLRRGRPGQVIFETVFILDSVRNLRRRPDLAFVSEERWPTDRSVPEEGDWLVVPDLVVEVISPNDLDKDVMAKLREYFHYGVRRVWIARPLDGQVYVYKSFKDVEIFGPDGDLTDEELFPGLRIPMEPIFRRGGD